MDLVLAPLLLTAASVALDYHVVVAGPDGSVDQRCADPCLIERVAVVGTAGGTSNTEVATTRDRSNEERGAECSGNCGSSRSTELRINISPSRKLREGIEVRIEDGRAHVILYDVVETEGGRSTRRRHSEFEIDRPVIELDVYGNDLRIETTGLPDAG